MVATFAKRSLGQNFLQDLSMIAQIVEAVEPQPDETIVEIGPGRGALTELLVRSGARVIALELDDRLSYELRADFAGVENFSLITGDALELELPPLIAPAASARIVANLPYNISTAILQRLIEQRESIVDMTLMLQREVVERISAGPDDPERGFLSVFVEAYCDAEKLLDVPPSAFKPVPKVWSSVVRLTPRETIPSGVDQSLLWPLVSAGFGQRRKTMLNNLKSSPGVFAGAVDAVQIDGVLLAAAIEPSRRAQTLTLAEWLDLTRSIQRLIPDRDA
jgi:16S rRNA (adenine1518-N6/adenine1519-N6)-dimethyltransferase